MMRAEQEAPCLHPPHPLKTDAARHLLASSRTALTAPLRMLLISVDGRRSAAQLLDMARSLGLGGDALARLRAAGLIASPAAPAAAAARPAVLAAAPAPAAATQAPAPAAHDDLRRLVRAKMFALDLAGRMLAGRDADLRASAREVDSESRFLDWLADAAARIEAAADAERAQLFRERVARAVEQPPGRGSGRGGPGAQSTRRRTSISVSSQAAASDLGTSTHGQALGVRAAARSSARGAALTGWRRRSSGRCNSSARWTCMTAPAMTPAV